MKRSTAVAVVALAAAVVAARTAPQSTAAAPAGADLAELWIDPVDLESRDLYYGPGGKAHAPRPDTPFEILAEDETGYSGGFDVRDPQGTEWSVKTGLEAQPEVAVSRILWAIGYHQPVTYLLVDWKARDPKADTAGAARFRREVDTERAVAVWSWYENPFAGTQPFNGLIVANLLLNNWDLKTSNNKIYEVADGSGVSRRRYVVRDLGAALGKTNYPQVLKPFLRDGIAQGSRNDLEDFESQGFITNVNGDRVTFDYDGLHPGLVKTVRASDVVWLCTLMDRLSDEQLTMAFRAAGYTPEYQRRYAAKIRAKIREGRALRQPFTQEARIQ